MHGPCMGHALPCMVKMGIALPCMVLIGISVRAYQDSFTICMFGLHTFKTRRSSMHGPCMGHALPCMVNMGIALPCMPGLKSQSKSALNSAVSEISKISALISAVSEWVKKTSADQRCFRAVQRWFSLNQRCSALDQNEVKNRRKCFV